MMLFLLQACSLVLPILLSGLVFIWVLRQNHFRWLNTPIDGGAKLGGRRLFGDNKTWRGAAIYIIVSVAVCSALAMVQPYTPGLHPVFSSPPLALGLLFSLSYILGELINSFIKRRAGIGPGRQSGRVLQKAADNIDGMVVVSVALILVYQVTVASILTAVSAGIVLHTLTDVGMRRLGLKTE